MLTRLVHFLVLGAALAFLAPDDETPPGPATIEIHLAPLRARFEAREGRAPDPRELDALVRAAVDEEILLRAAIALGADRRDPVVRRHLVGNLRFAATGPDDDDALFAEALALGMERTDPVARRRLAFAAEQTLRAAGRGEEPTDEELRRHLEENATSFAEDARVRFTHVFLSARRRGDSLADDATRLLEAFQREDPPPADAVGRGDPWLLAHTLPPSSRRDVARTFGASFAEALFAMPDGGWSGPLSSAHGLHLIRIHERRPGAAPRLETVRDRVRYAVYARREEAALREGLARLREGFDLRLVDGERP